MRKRIIAILFITLFAGVTGCNRKPEETEIVKEAIADSLQTEVSATTETEEEEIPLSTYDGLTFVKPGTEQEYLLSSDNFDKEADFTFFTPKKVALYSIDGIKVAEAETNVELHVTGTASRYAWVELENPVANTKYEHLYLLRDLDVDPIITVAEQNQELSAGEQNQSEDRAKIQQNESSSIPEENHEQTQPEAGSIQKEDYAQTQPEDNTPSVDNAQVQLEEAVDKYTPEEAIAVYRSIVEANGMIWDPSLAGNWNDTVGQFPVDEWYLHYDNYSGSDWGTGFIDLSKGGPEEAAYSDLKSYAMGDTIGNPWTHYYIQILGSDDFYVEIVGWSSY